MLLIDIAASRSSKRFAVKPAAELRHVGEEKKMRTIGVMGRVFDGLGLYARQLLRHLVSLDIGSYAPKVQACAVNSQLRGAACAYCVIRGYIRVAMAIMISVASASAPKSYPIP